MDLLVITGMSGAGKSKAITSFEDMGYYCLDNIPPDLIESFANYCTANEEITKAAIVTDGRAAGKFENFTRKILDLRTKGLLFKLVFLDATDEVLLKRYKETRRPHVFLEHCNGNIKDAIDYERKLLMPLLIAADYHVDTSSYLPAQLKTHLIEVFEHGHGSDMSVNIMSFGFKHGIPTDADMVFDVRSFTNPFYNESLRHMNGTQKEVQDCVMGDPDARIFTDNLITMVNHLIPCCIKDGRASFTIAIGCTGGHHRSVTIAERLGDHVNKNITHCVKTHRDIKK